MVKYNCEKCGFFSKNKKDYTRHIKTKKHLKKNNKQAIKISDPNLILKKSYKSPKYENVCIHCNNSYTNQSNLTRHMKKCSNLIIIEKDNIIQTKEVDALKKENERLHKQVEKKDKQLETFSDLLKSSMSKSTGNNLTYIVNNYGSAPQLEGLPSYTHILDADTMTLPQVLIMYHQNNTLCRFIGEFLVKAYVKKGGNNQAMWSSDTSRLTYIINELQESGKIQWVLDKKGVKIKKYVINPLLHYLKDEIEKYIDENSFCTTKQGLCRLQAAIEIYSIIDKEILANGIVKYMAPYFTLLKEDKNIKLLKN
jgi:uncharacterized C2H2 Zn-finger protein